MLKLSIFQGCSGSVPLNANELQLPTQGAELQECVWAAPITSSRHMLKCQKLFCLLCLNQRWRD